MGPPSVRILASCDNKAVLLSPVVSSACSFSGLHKAYRRCQTAHVSRSHYDAPLNYRRAAPSAVLACLVGRTHLHEWIVQSPRSLHRRRRPGVSALLSEY